MGLFTWKISIAAPPAEVFAVLADVPRHGSWADAKSNLRVEQVAGDGPGLGAKYRSQQVFVGKPNTADLEIVAYQPTTKFALSIAQRAEGKTKDQHIVQAFTLSPEGAGTLLTKEMTSPDGGIGGTILGLIAYPAIKKNGYESLKNLKAKLEGSSGDA